MKVNDRVKHSKYGLGTILHIMFEVTRREMYLVKFDVSNSELHNGFEFSSKNDCKFCVADELEVLINE